MDRNSIRRMSHAVGIITALLLLVLSACGPSIKPFASRELKGGEGVRMAILPFDNLSSTQGAGKSIEGLVLIEFLKRSTLKVVDPGEVQAVLSKERIRLATSIPKETVRTLGEGLGVRLLMMGTVHQYEMQAATGAGAGNMPVIAISLRIIEVETGDIVWASTVTRRGNDRELVFGIGKIQSLNQLAEETAMELAQAFADSIKKE
jgi:TolB-like protein